MSLANSLVTQDSMQQLILNNSQSYFGIIWYITPYSVTFQFMEVKFKRWRNYRTCEKTSNKRFQYIFFTFESSADLISFSLARKHHTNEQTYMYYVQISIVIYLFCLQIVMLFVLILFVLYLVYPLLRVSLDCPFLIATSVFSNVYLKVHILPYDTRSLVLYVCFVDRCLSLCTFSFGHCVVCSSSICVF